MAMFEKCIQFSNLLKSKGGQDTPTHNESNIYYL
jgi:hypothetical protein